MDAGEIGVDVDAGEIVVDVDAGEIGVDVDAVVRLVSSLLVARQDSEKGEICGATGARRVEKRRKRREEVRGRHVKRAILGPALTVCHTIKRLLLACNLIAAYFPHVDKPIRLIYSRSLPPSYTSKIWKTLKSRCSFLLVPTFSTGMCSYFYR